MHIEDVLLAPGHGAFFYDDQAAIRSGVETDGFRYIGSPLTPGFPAVRIPAETLGIGLVLSNKSIAWGDMMGVQYAGAAGRDPLFRSREAAELVRRVLFPRLQNIDVLSFRSSCAEVLAPSDGYRLPAAIEYGVSQAMLNAAAEAGRCTPAEVICAEFGLPIPKAVVPIYAQSGDAREINVDKMILRGVDVLPHGLINSRAKFGADGQAFRDFVRWVGQRIRTIGVPGYNPILHFDVYGWIGLEIGLDPSHIAGFIASIADEVPGFLLHIECPADFGSLTAQVDGYGSIVEAMRRLGTTAKIVVDERCNTLSDIKAFARARAADLVQIKMPDVGSIADIVSAVLVCKENGIGAYLGGSCVETDLSAKLSVHVAVATQADMMLAKPGMGVDEAVSIVGNEQSRLFAALARQSLINRADHE
ncbi:MAG: methylaspartate ammonia-lyase [Hyphomicrobiales bacterium]|nr:methylaspartate ammonia-lyase [Hyphomicrobiales bacterium]